MTINPDHLFLGLLILAVLSFLVGYMFVSEHGFRDFIGYFNTWQKNT